MERKRITQPQILILAGIIILAVGLRFYGLDRQSLWYDEAYDKHIAESIFFYEDMNLSEPITAPLNILLKYPVLKFWPDSDLFLRMPSFVFGVVTVLLIFMLGRQFFNEEVGLIAALLLAVSPFHIWYSQEARMYSLQWMLALISMIYFLKSLDQPIRKNYIFYILPTVLGLYTHHLTVLLLTIQGVYLLISYNKYRKQIFKWIGLFSLVVLFYLPLFIYNQQFLLKHQFGFPKETSIMAIPYTIFAFFAGFSIGPSLRELHMNQSLAVILPYAKEIIPLVGVFGTVFAFGLWSSRKNKFRTLLLLILIVPVGGMFILDKMLININYSVRHTGVAFFGFILVLANGIYGLSCLKFKKKVRYMSVFAMILITGFSAHAYINYQFNNKYKKEDIRGAVAYIKANKADEDVIVCIPFSQVFFRYSGQGFECSIFPEMDRYNEKIVDIEMNKIVKQKKRLWLVLTQEWHSADLHNYINKWAEINYRELKKFHKDIDEIANVKIFSYDLTQQLTINGVNQ